MPISHGNGQMAAQSISIMTSSRERCNGGCEFCISRTTPGVDAANCDIRRCSFPRLNVGLNYSMRLGATHGILTGKADPSQEDPTYLVKLVESVRQYLPLCDMHTNGFLFLPGMPKSQVLGDMVEAGLTMITLSIASFDADSNQKLMHLKRSGAELIPHALELGLLVRCSLVVNRQGVQDFEGVLEYIRQAGELGAHMVVVREVWIPEAYGDYNHNVYEWNKQNKVPIEPIQAQFVEAAKQRTNPHGIQLRDPLPWGTPVFAVGGIFSQKNHGVNVTFALCDEATTGSVIKSIVHKPDGHGYRNWDHNGDILY